MDLTAHIRKIPDFPKPGILFYDISTLLQRPGLGGARSRAWPMPWRAYRPDLLAGIELRGFVFAAPVAARLGLGFAMIRKQGKLPGAVASHAYDLEYGSDTLRSPRADRAGHARGPDRTT